MAKRKTRNLIKDPAEKFELLKSIFIVETNFGLAQAILNIRTIEHNTEKVKLLQDSLNGYFALSGRQQVSPSGARGAEFIRELTNRLINKGCDETDQQIAYAITRGSIQEFRKIIPKNICVLEDDGNELSNQGIKTNQSMPKCNNLFSMYFPLKSSYLTAKNAFDNGRIDQKFHYLSPDSEKNWSELIANIGYKQFDECKTALDLLCTGKDKEKVWCKFFEEDGANGVIILGGGSVPKDMVIIRETLKLLPSNGVLNYLIVDYSNYMLKSSLRKIHDALIQEYLVARVNLQILEHDFLKLNEVKGFRPTLKNVAWVIPGGTIGNINEGILLNSVASEAIPGDLVVIGAETIEIDDTSLCDSLVKKYQSPEVRRFLETPLRSIWHELKCTETIDSALNRIVPEVVDGLGSKYSDVPESKTVELSLAINGRKIVLATSTRYVENNLIEFAGRSGFKYEISLNSPLNPRYKQFVFRYDPLLQ